MAKTKATAESKFVTGSKQTKAPKPKSLTPKIKSGGDKKRAGKYGKVVNY
jgi:hypothetical protein